MPPLSGEPPFAAACMVHDTAIALAADGTIANRTRYLAVAARLAPVLDAQATRQQILAASPRVVERSGRIRTLVEMIEDEPGDDLARFRLATLLMRALIWNPADLASARETIQHNRELTRYQGLMIARRLDEIRRFRIGNK